MIGTIRTMSNMGSEVFFKDRHFASIHNFNEMDEGLSFLTRDESFIQVGTWNYEKNKILDAHYHNYFERNSYRTQEVVIVLEGKIKCNLFTEEGLKVHSEVINEGQMIIQYEGVHEYEILENTKVIEVKNGPYFGPEKDRTRINVRKN